MASTHISLIIKRPQRASRFAQIPKILRIWNFGYRVFVENFSISRLREISEGISYSRDHDFSVVSKIIFHTEKPVSNSVRI